MTSEASRIPAIRGKATANVMRKHGLYLNVHEAFKWRNASKKITAEVDAETERLLGEPSVQKRIAELAARPGNA